MSKILYPAQALGVAIGDTQFLRDSYALSQRLLNCDDPTHHPDNLGGLSWLDLAGNQADRAARIAENLYLSGRWSECIEWCHKTWEAHEYYFFGDWQEKEPHDDGLIDRRMWFEEEPTMTWAQYFDLFVPWVAVGHYWDLVSRLFEFPRPGVGADLDGPAPRAYYIGLAQWWRDRQDTQGLEEAKSVRGAGSKYYHLLCDIAMGISVQNEATLKKAFPKAVQHFLKRRDHEEQFPMAATFLWNVAKHDGIILEMPEEISKFLFEIPENYWNVQETSA